MNALMKFLEKGVKNPRSGGESVGGLENLLARLSAGGEAAGKTALGLGARGVRGIKERPVIAGLGAAGGAGAMALGEDEEKSKLAQLLEALGLG